MIRIVRCCYNHPHLKFFLQAEIRSFTMIQLRSFTIIQLRQNGALASNILFTNRNMAHAETNMFIQYDPTRQNGNNQQLFLGHFWNDGSDMYWSGVFDFHRHIINIFKKHAWSGYMWAMVNTHYMVEGHPIHNKDPYNGYYKSLWTIGWLAPINGYQPWVLTIAHVDYEMKPIPYSISPVQQATAFGRRHSGQFTYVFAQSPCHGRILDTLPKQW